MVGLDSSILRTPPLTPRSPRASRSPQTPGGARRPELATWSPAEQGSSLGSSWPRHEARRRRPQSSSGYSRLSAGGEAASPELKSRLRYALQDRDVPTVRRLLRSRKFGATDPVREQAEEHLRKWQPYHASLAGKLANTGAHTVEEAKQLLVRWPFSQNDPSYQEAADRVRHALALPRRAGSASLTLSELREELEEWPYLRQGPQYWQMGKTLAHWEHYMDELSACIESGDIRGLEYLLDALPFGRDDECIGSAWAELEKYEEDCAALKVAVRQRQVLRLEVLVRSWTYDPDLGDFQQHRQVLDRWLPDYGRRCAEIGRCVEDRHVGKLREGVESWPFSEEDKKFQKAREYLSSALSEYQEKLEELRAALAASHMESLRDRLDAWPFSHQDDAVQEAKEQMLPWQRQCTELRAAIKDKHVVKLQTCTERWRFSQDDSTFRQASDELALWLPEHERRCAQFLAAIKDRQVPALEENVGSWPFSEQDDSLRRAREQLDDWLPEFRSKLAELHAAMDDMHVELLHDCLSRWPFSKLEERFREARARLEDLLPDYERCCAALEAAAEGKRVACMEGLVEGWRFSKRADCFAKAQKQLTAWLPEYRQRQAALRAGVDDKDVALLREHVGAWPFSQEDGPLAEARGQLEKWLPEYTQRCKALSLAIRQASCKDLREGVDAWPFSQQDETLRKAKTFLEEVLPAWHNDLERAIGEAKGDMYKNFRRPPPLPAVDGGREAALLEELGVKGHRKVEWGQILQSFKPDAIEVAFDIPPQDLAANADLAGEVFAALAALGADGESLSPLRVSNRGSGVCKLDGPASAVGDIRTLPLQKLEVMGHLAKKVSLHTDPPQGAPRSAAIAGSKKRSRAAEPREAELQQLQQHLPGLAKLHRLLDACPYPEGHESRQQAEWMLRFCSIGDPQGVEDFFNQSWDAAPQAVKQDADVSSLKGCYDTHRGDAAYVLELQMLVARAEQLIAQADLDPSFWECEELQEIIALCGQYKQCVKALCGTPWLKWYDQGGNCQVCERDVGRAEKGMRCKAGGHWICWVCIVKNIDAKLLIERKKAAAPTPAPEPAPAPPAPGRPAPGPPAPVAPSPQPSALATQGEHRRSGVLFSGRFDGGEKEKLIRAAAEACKKREIEVHIVEAHIGEKYGEMTCLCLYRMAMMVAFAFEDYGQKTQAKYCTYYEVQYAYDYDIPIVPFKFYDGKWPPAPLDTDGGANPRRDSGKAQNSMVLGPQKVYQSFSPPFTADVIDQIADGIAKTYHARVTNAAR